MRFNLKVPDSLLPFYREELRHYRFHLQKDNLKAAWRHLERAHIIIQKYPFAHTKVHWLMLKFGFRIKSSKEIIGQIPRLLLGGVKSFVGKVPLGNTGGADIPPLKSLPYDEDIMEIFRKAGVPF